MTNPTDRNVADTLKLARDYADIQHRGQKYGDVPYIAHCDAVVSALIRHNVFDKDLIAAAYLHDTMEDTGSSYADLEELFGARIATLVAAVTNTEGRNRAQKLTFTFRERITKLPEAVVIKLADRIANVESSFLNKAAGRRSLFDMYEKEQPLLTSLARPVIMGLKNPPRTCGFDMLESLNDLFFMYVE